jgi:hypothetical protein
LIRATKGNILQNKVLYIVHSYSDATQQFNGQYITPQSSTYSQRIAEREAENAKAAAQNPRKVAKRINSIVALLRHSSLVAQVFLPPSRN